MKTWKRKKKSDIHPMAKLYSGFHPDTPDSEVQEYWSHEFREDVIEKPCGVLAWCPYGILVEEFPLPDEGDTPGFDDGTWMPLREPQACRVFGHFCPAFYVSEPLADPDALEDNCICDECRAEARAEKLATIAASGGAPSPREGSLHHGC